MTADEARAEVVERTGIKARTPAIGVTDDDVRYYAWSFRGGSACATVELRPDGQVEWWVREPDGTLHGNEEPEPSLPAEAVALIERLFPEEATPEPRPASEGAPT